jgi:hypothetical protein
MVMQIYNSSTRLFTEQDGTEHHFFNGEAEFPEEAMTLIKFKQGEISLQEAYTVLLRLGKGYAGKDTMELEEKKREVLEKSIEARLVHYGPTLAVPLFFMARG